MPQSYSYIIIGGGVAGASAVEGIRELDPQGSILLIGRETNRPYDRPTLSKQLWTGAKSVPEIFLHGFDFYKQARVEMRLGIASHADRCGAAHGG